jgi:hypothetical protein
MNNNNNNNNNIPSIHSLHKEKTQKENSKFKIFEIVLSKCIEKIVYTNRHTDKTFVIFEVPKILIGYPMYDMKSCILYLLNKLSESSYLVEFIDPFYLYIDWGCVTQSTATKIKTINKLIPTSNPNKLKHQTQKLLDKYPDTNKIEFIYQDLLTNNNKKKSKK